MKVNSQLSIIISVTWQFPLERPQGTHCLPFPPCVPRLATRGSGLWAQPVSLLAALLQDGLGWNTGSIALIYREISLSAHYQGSISIGGSDLDLSLQCLPRGLLWGQWDPVGLSSRGSKARGSKGTLSPPTSAPAHTLAPAGSPLTLLLIPFVSQKQFPTTWSSEYFDSVYSPFYNQHLEGQLWLWLQFQETGECCDFELKDGSWTLHLGYMLEERTSLGPRAVQIPGPFSFHKTFAVFCFSFLLPPPMAVCLLQGHSLIKVSWIFLRSVFCN